MRPWLRWVGAAIAGSVVAALVLVPAASAATKVTWRSYDDGNFSYQGEWTVAEGVGKFKGSDRYTLDANASYALAFEGVGVRVLVTKDQHHGTATVAIDGGPGVQIDLHSTSRQYQQQVFSKSGLRAGRHTIRVTATGRAVDGATGSVVVADRIDVAKKGGGVANGGGSTSGSRKGTVSTVVPIELTPSSGTVPPTSATSKPKATTSTSAKQAEPSGGASEGRAIGQSAAAGHLVKVPAATRTLYVDAARGNDGAAGTSEGAAWRSLAKATGALTAGDHLLLAKGSTWHEALDIAASGSAGKEIVVDAYGTGAAPVVTGASECALLRGSNIIVQHLTLTGCSWAGVEFRGDNDVVQSSTLSHSVAGATTAGGANHSRILGNAIVDNDKMSVNTQGGDDDSGAFGVLLNGSNAEVGYNTISGSDAPSYDYGRDGAAVEIFKSAGNTIHHNLTYDNETFSELGGKGTDKNTFSYNVATSKSKGAFMVLRGGGDGLGPNTGTVVDHNSAYLPKGEGLVCYAGCDSSILRMTDTIIQVGGGAALDVDGNATLSGNVYYGGAVKGGGGKVADPQFVDPGNHDLHLKAGSPAAKAGAYAG